MGSARDEIMERLIDLCGATAVAAAAGFAAFRLGPPELLPWGAVSAACAGFVLAYGVLRTIGGKPPLFGPMRFDPQAIKFEPEPEALLLDDILANLGPDSRVVRMFEPALVPTAGQLQARIDSHIAGDSGEHCGDEASEALHAALAEIRRSLR